MANSKISGLTAATTPLAGTEELALLQTSDKRITVDNFAAGAVKSNATTGVLQVVGPVAASTRVMTTPDANFSVARTDALQTLTGNQTITNGNVVVSNGYGVDFSATPGTGTSELFADYEEGTWTPNKGSGITAVGAFSSSGWYTKIGRQVVIMAKYTAGTSVACAGAGGQLSTNAPFASTNSSVGAVTNDGQTIGETAIIADTGNTFWLGGAAIAATPFIYVTITYNT